MNWLFAVAFTTSHRQHGEGGYNRVFLFSQK
jgi:hypothetical protein